MTSRHAFAQRGKTAAKEGEDNSQRHTTKRGVAASPNAPHSQSGSNQPGQPKGGGHQPARGICPAAPSLHTESARPDKLLRRPNQPSLHGIPLDVPPHAGKLVLAPDESVEVLTLPKSRTSPTEKQVDPASATPLHQSDHISQRNGRSPKHMDMVRHHDIGMHRTSPHRGDREDFLLDDPSHRGLPQHRRAAASLIEQPVHHGKRGARGNGPSEKRPMGRQTTRQPPSHEHRFAGGIHMRQSASIDSHPAG